MRHQSYWRLHLVLLLMVAACSFSQRNDTIRASLGAVNAVRDGFMAWDASHQQALVEKATSRTDGEKALADYHAKREPLLNLFEIVYRALAVAATQTDDPSLKAALGKASELIDAVKKLTGGP